MDSPGTFRELVISFLSLSNSLIAALIGLGILILLIGVFRYSLKAGSNSEGRTELRDFLSYGLLAMFVMVSFWGILSFLLNSFSIGGVGGGSGGGGAGTGSGGGGECATGDPSCCDPVTDPFCLSVE